MASISIVDEFMKCLQEAERSGDPKSLINLFSDDAECMALTRHNVNAKQEGVPHAPVEFWRQYLRAFDDVQSKFVNVIDSGNAAVLEWHSTGALPNGFPIDYNGVSIVEYSEGKISAFRTYYDSAALLPHVPRAAKTISETAGAPEITNQATS